MSDVKKLLRSQVSQLWIPAQPHTLWGLTVFPIYRRVSWNPFRRQTVAYAPLAEGLEKSDVTVGEMPSAHVPELLVTNKGRVILLAIDGDEVVGGHQNRIFNASVLIGKGETRVPVSCVERGRWDGSRAAFKSGERLPHGARSKSHGHVHENLSHRKSYASDQGEVWRDVESGHSKHGVHSRTHSMHDFYDAQRGKLKAFEEAIPYPRNAVGMIVAIGGRIVACDVFDQAKTAEHYWPRLIRACAAEALDAEHKVPEASAESLLQELWKCQAEVFDSAGLGQDVRLKSKSVRGSALVHQDVIVHMSLFAEVN